MRWVIIVNSHCLDFLGDTMSVKIHLSIYHDKRGNSNSLVECSNKLKNRHAPFCLAWKTQNFAFCLKPPGWSEPPLGLVFLGRRTSAVPQLSVGKHKWCVWGLFHRSPHLQVAQGFVSEWGFVLRTTTCSFGLKVSLDTTVGKESGWGLGKVWLWWYMGFSVVGCVLLVEIRYLLPSLVMLHAGNAVWWVRFVLKCPLKIQG